MKGIRYKLSIMGALIDEPVLVFYDNKLVVTSNLVPQSTFGDNHLGILYHAVRFAVSAMCRMY